MKILFAEDDYASRKFTSTFLKKYGEVDTTINGEEAVSAFQIAIEEKNYYDLVCLDIMMPGTDGIEALYLIREIEKKANLTEEKKAKIVMVSALSDNNSKGEAYEFGCDAYVSKPLETGKFEKVLSDLGFLSEKDGVLK